MADVKFETIRVALNGSVGTQNITISGFGTPIAAIFTAETLNTDNTITAGSEISVGYTDGTSSACVVVDSVDGVSTTNTNRAQRTDRVLSNVGLSVSSSFSSWVTDGVQITNNSASTRFVTVTLIGGADVINAKVEFKQLTSTSNNITTTGFEPDLVFLNSIGLNTLAGSTVSTDLLSNGIAINDGVDSNYGYLQYQENAVTTTNTGQWVSSTHSVGQYFNGSLNWGGAVGSYVTSGFTITTSASTGNDYICYLALKFQNSPLIDVSIEDSPTVTGTKHFGSTGSAPSFHMMLTSNAPSLVAASSGLGHTFYTADTTNQYTNGISGQDNVSTSVTDSISTSGRLQQLFNGAKQFDSTFTSFDSTGANYNFTSVDGTSRKWISMFIGDGVGGGISITAESGTYLYTGSNTGLLATKLLQANSSTYNYTGTNIDLLRGLNLNASTGTYVYSGANASLLKGFTLAANSGSYVYTGTNSDLIFTPVGSFTLSANTGAYVYQGTNINFNQNRVIIASSGTYTYSGSNISIVLPGQIWTDKPSVSTSWNNQANVITNWGDKTTVTTIWTDK